MGADVRVDVHTYVRIYKYVYMSYMNIWLKGLACTQEYCYKLQYKVILN